MKLLSAHAVDYVVIGARAMPVHGYSRTTADFDFFIRPDRANAARVIDALREFGYDVSDLSVEDVLTYKVLLRQYALESDFHPSVTGIEFEQVWRNRVTALFRNTPTVFASLDDLIQMKQAANRPKDLEDLKFLLALRDRKKK
ncbi:MAG: hypothetical protein NTU83_08170 [Candidatus Hydrogenedentes bacterium]|nr:hypothetical protein [Candidatus Hydrogenedentota bacterium]